MPTTIKLNPLSQLEGNSRRQVLMVWVHCGAVHLMKHDSLVGVQCKHDWGDKMPMPDGWIEPVEVEE